MKTLSTITAALLLTISLSSFAADKTPANKISFHYSVKNYIDAITLGNTDNLDALLDNSLTYRFVRGKEIKSYGKQDVVKALKAAGQVEQNCQTSYQTSETEEGQSVVLITMKYSDFTKITRLTMADSADGWKINRIASWYE